MNEAEKSGSSIGSRIGAGFAKVGKAVTVGIGAASAAVGTLATMSVKGYTDYEQLAGGVETLFGKSSKSVIDNAQKAYKTAGMSANEYMETSIQSAAAMINSLGGNQAKASELMNMSITDMSDNVNKMGTNMQSVQDAYKGFSRGNFTMLDNLALGFAGTKEGMQQLLDKAEEISGVKYDISSYSDIVQAIHVVQTEMGITGTTAKEASTTIQGSLKSAKSAWDNLLTGLSDDKADIDKLVNNFFDSVVTVGENIIPRIGVVLNGITGMIEKLAPKITAKLPSIFKQILPSIVKGATSLLGALIGILPELGKTITKLLPNFIKAVASIFKGIVNALPGLVKTIAEALPTLIPQIITALIDMAVYLMEHISEIIQPIIDNLPDILISIVNALMDNLPKLIDGAISLVLGLVDALPDIIMGLIDALPTVIEKIISGLLDALPRLIEGLIELDLKIVEHLPEIMAESYKATPKVIESIVKALLNAAPKLWDAFTKIFSNAWEKVQEVFSAVGTWFSDIFSGAWEGIKTAWDGVKGFFVGIWDGIKSVFEGIGKWFGKIFTDAVDNIKKAWSGVTDFFSRLWEGIWEVIRTPINWIIDGINTIIGGLNSLAIDVPDWVPLVGGQHWGISIPEIPKIPETSKLARGGVVDKPTPAIFGENGAEAVVPLENNKKWISRVANEMVSALGVQPQKAGLGRNFNQTFNVTVNVGKINDDLDINNVVTKISEQLAQEVRRKENLYA